MALSADGSNRLPRVYLDPLISFHISLLMLPTGDASNILALDAKQQQQKKKEAEPFQNGLCEQQTGWQVD